MGLERVKRQTKIRQRKIEVEGGDFCRIYRKPLTHTQTHLVQSNRRFLKLLFNTVTVNIQSI